MSLLRNEHHHVLFFFQKSLRQLFWSAFLRQNGVALVDIFTFVYFYTLGSSQRFFSWIVPNGFQQGILTIVSVVLIVRCTEILIIFPMARIAARFGLPKAAIIGNILMGIRYALLACSVRYPTLIFSAAILQGIEISVFAPAYDTMFAKRASLSKVGRDVGAFTFILQFSHALLPAFAGGLIVSFGFPAAFIGAAILLLFSNIPLLALRVDEKLRAPTARGFFVWYRKTMDRSVLLAIVGRYVSGAGYELWLVYLLILFGKVEKLGVLVTAALLISLFLSYFSGWIVDHSRKSAPFVTSGFLLALFWILRINIVTASFVILLEIMQRIVESFYYPSFDSLMYRISKKVDTFSFHVYREFLTCIASIAYWSCIGVMFLLYGEIWNLIFVLGAIGILSSTLLYSNRYE